MEQLKNEKSFSYPRSFFKGSLKATSIMSLLALSMVFLGCLNRQRNWISAIKADYYKNNFLKIKIVVETTKAVALQVEYWDSLAYEPHTRQSTSAATRHEVILYNLKPNSKYHYRFTGYTGADTLKSEVFHLKTPTLPEYMDNELFIEKSKSDRIPQAFREGLILLNKRETPGILYMVDYRGQIFWYHRISEAGFKVSTFNRGGTILSIIGTNDDPTSYGRSILEINKFGDTTLFFRQGTGDLPKMIHHEIITRGENEIVTLFCDNRAFDLRAVGGGVSDTVKGDGIIVLNRKGKKIWQWSIFDVLNPIKFSDINKVKDDWAHANSLMIDHEGNFLISFYNLGQIWKVDAVSGRVIWKLGQGGTMKVGKECEYEQSHAIHYNPRGSLMFFDNGFKKKASSIIALKVDERGHAVNLDFKVNLPPQMFNERMGSAYMINDSTLLGACSKRHKTFLSNLKGEVYWVLHSNFPSYRAQFIPDHCFDESQVVKGERELQGKKWE